MALKQEELTQLVEHLKEKNSNLEEDIQNKNRRINELNEMIVNKGDSKSKKSFF
jgi:uncharacterized protein YoxC